MRKTIKVLAGWIHATLILALVIPLIYAMGMSQAASTEVKLYAKCLIIAFPVVLTSLAIKYCKNLLSYLMICIFIFAAVFYMAWWLVPVDPDGTTMWGYVVMIILQTLLIIIMRFFDRVDAKSSHEEDMVSSPYWNPEYNLLDKPNVFLLIYFFIIYVICKNFDNPAVCNAAFISAIIYLFITILYEYIVRTEEYLSLNKRVCNLPSKRIYGISSGVLALFLLLLMIFTIPSLLTIHQRQYTDFRKWLEGRTIDYGDLISESEKAQGNMPNPLGEFIMEQGPPKELPFWVDILFYIVEAGVIIFFIILVLKGVYGTFHKFKDTYDENGDIVEALEKTEVEESEKKLSKEKNGKISEREKVRRHYRKVIKKHRKETPYPHETPLEIEVKAGIADSEEGKQLHILYEKSRYGR